MCNDWSKQNINLIAKDRIGFRRIDNHKPEIVKWDPTFETCYVLAFFEIHDEGYDLRFVGPRPFSEDHKAFMKIAYAAQQILDSISEMRQDD